MKLNDLTSEYLKGLGFKSKKIGIEFIQEHIQDYKKLSAGELDVQLRAAKAEYEVNVNKQLEDESSARSLTTALQNVGAIPTKVGEHARVEALDNGEFKPKYIQLPGGTRMWRDGTTTLRNVTLSGYKDFVPAYAMTIHKVQGLTLDTINVYLRKSQLKNANATKLLYVALTRVRDASKIHLRLLD